MGRNIELPDEMPRGVAAVVSFEDGDGVWRSVAFDEAGDAWRLLHGLGNMGRHARLERVELVAEYSADDVLEGPHRREREAYERFMAADWRTAGERLDEWLDAWRALREATEEGR